MNTKISAALVALLGLGAAGSVLADCAAEGTLAGTRESYTKGQQLEKAGDTKGAFGAYVAAQEYTCEANPVEAPAAQRAAALALPLGTAAEKKGDLDLAFHYYENGGHYAAADRVLIATVRAKPDDPSAFSRAREILDARALPAFQSNNQARLNAAGKYQPDPKLLAEVLAMPAKGAERAFQKEATAFNEEYLRGYVQLIQSRPSDPTDFAAMQAATGSYQSFMQKWPNDPLETSLQALRLVQAWGSASTDPALTAKLETQRKQRLEQRVATLTKSYAGAPKFLDAAKDYQFAANLDDAVTQSRVAAIKSQASKLGDEANAKQRYELAAEYYGVADEDAKAQAARDAQQKLAMNKMQPQVDQMRQQAEQLQQEYSDPAKVKAMQEQARAAQKSLQQQQKANAAANAKKADELEKELGM